MGKGAKKGNGSQDGKNVSGERKVFVVPSSRIVSEKGYAVKDSHAYLIKHNQAPGSGQMAPRWHEEQRAEKIDHWLSAFALAQPDPTTKPLFQERQPPKT